MTRRTERINDLLREEISDLIHHELKDPRIAGLISVTEVDVSPDLTLAKVFVSVLGSPDEKRASFAVLDRSSGFMQRELRRRLTIRRTPQLVFIRDDSMERGQRILSLLDRERGDDGA